MASDGNLYKIYDDNINSNGLGLVLPSSTDAFIKLGYKDTTNQPYIPVHSATPLQALGVIGASSVNTIINFYNKYETGDPTPISNLSANKPVGLFQGNERLRGQLNKDIFIRGGISAPSYAIEDAQRLAKFFFDKKDVTGLLFTIKQNVLSQTNVRTIASSLVNGGIYLPTSTIAQAGVNAFGVHLNKQGIDPTGLTPLSITTYEEASQKGIKKSDRQIERVEKRQERLRNKKQKLYEKIIEEDNTKKRDRQLKRKANLTSKIEDLEFSKANKDRLFSLWTKHIQTPSNTPKIFGYPGGPGSILGIGFTRIKFATDNKGNTLRTGESNANYIEPQIPSQRPDYSIFNIENSYGFNSPGKKGDRNNYVEGKKTEDGKYLVGPSDKINGWINPTQQSLRSIYYSANPKINSLDKDIIDFHIGVIDNLSDASKFENTYWIPFRAFIEDFSDQYSAKWKGHRYMGRAEQFYKYDAFDRDISLSFKVVAQSKQELMVQYEKLNFLASTLAPTYSTRGYMSGNLHRIYIGGYLNDQVCLIESLSFDFKDSPWEIAIDAEGNPDSTTSQLPHYIDVKMKLTPIHRFRVEMEREYTLDGKPDPEKIQRPYISRTNLQGSRVALQANFRPTQTTSTSSPTSTSSEFLTTFGNGIEVTDPGVQSQIDASLGLWMGP